MLDTELNHVKIIKQVEEPKVEEKPVEKVEKKLDVVKKVFDRK